MRRGTVWWLLPPDETVFAKPHCCLQSPHKKVTRHANCSDVPWRCRCRCPRDARSSPIRVSSVQDLASQLTVNSQITGGVEYFGHGAGVRYPDGTYGSILAPGEQAGPDTNISADNVGLLSNAQLDPGATITLHACYAGLGAGRYSIAQLIANQLQRRVFAPRGGTFFTVDPNSRNSGGTAPQRLPSSKPIYQLQDGGVPFGMFLPSLHR